MDFFVLVLVVYGITNIIVQGSIFDGVKEKLSEMEILSKNKALKWFLGKFNTIINCPMCSSFHVGWFVGMFFGPFAAWNIIFNGALFSGTTWIIHSIVQFLGNGGEPTRGVVLMTEDPIAIKDINKEDSTDS